MLFSRSLLFSSRCILPNRSSWGVEYILVLSLIFNINCCHLYQPVNASIDPSEVVRGLEIACEKRGMSARECDGDAIHRESTISIARYNGWVINISWLFPMWQLDKYNTSFEDSKPTYRVFLLILIPTPFHAIIITSPVINKELTAALISDTHTHYVASRNEHCAA